MRVLVESYGDVRIFSERPYGYKRYIVEWQDGRTQMYSTSIENKVKELVEKEYLMPLYEFYNDEIDERYELMMTYDKSSSILKRIHILKKSCLTSLQDRVIDDAKEVLPKIVMHTCSNVHAKHSITSKENQMA